MGNRPPNVPLSAGRVGCDERGSLSTGLTWVDTYAFELGINHGVLGNPPPDTTTTTTTTTLPPKRASTGAAHATPGLLWLATSAAVATLAFML